MAVNKKYHQIIPSVHLFLFNQAGQILLSRRFNTGYKDGSFSVPAGHIERGEQALLAMQRETLEEIGLELSLADFHFVHVMMRHSRVGISQIEERVDFFFTANLAQDQKVKNCEPDRCNQLTWFCLGQLPDNIVAYVKHALLATQQKISYSEFLES